MGKGNTTPNSFSGAYWRGEFCNVVGRVFFIDDNDKRTRRQGNADIQAGEAVPPRLSGAMPDWGEKMIDI